MRKKKKASLLDIQTGAESASRSIPLKSRAGGKKKKLRDEWLLDGIKSRPKFLRASQTYDSFVGRHRRKGWGNFIGRNTKTGTGLYESTRKVR